MKKIFYIFSLLLVSLLIVGCRDQKDKDIALNVELLILDETVINHHIHISTLVPIDIEDEASLHHLMNELANEMYMDYFETIDGQLFYLYLHGYHSSVSFNEGDDPFFGTFVYGINLNVTRPGLSFVRVE